MTDTASETVALTLGLSVVDQLTLRAATILAGALVLRLLPALRSLDAAAVVEGVVLAGR